MNISLYQIYNLIENHKNFKIHEHYLRIYNYDDRSARYSVSIVDTKNKKNVKEYFRLDSQVKNDIREIYKTIHFIS